MNRTTIVTASHYKIICTQYKRKYNDINDGLFKLCANVDIVFIEDLALNQMNSKSAND